MPGLQPAELHDSAILVHELLVEALKFVHHLLDLVLLQVITSTVRSMHT